MKLISGGMIGNTNYIGTSLGGLLQEIKPKEIITFQFLQINFTKIKVIEHHIGLVIQT